MGQPADVMDLEGGVLPQEGMVQCQVGYGIVPQDEPEFLHAGIFAGTQELELTGGLVRGGLDVSFFEDNASKGRQHLPFDLGGSRERGDTAFVNSRKGGGDFALGEMGDDARHGFQAGGILSFFYRERGVVDDLVGEPPESVYAMVEFRRGFAGSHDIQGAGIHAGEGSFFAGGEGFEYGFKQGPHVADGVARAVWILEMVIQELVKVGDGECLHG